jgi:phosphatidylethanolamine/phosphatidyl-N-methylethanolamine N-methyltransferase
MKKTFWERTARFYDVAVKKGDAADREAVSYIAEFLPADCRLLEAACGTGRFSCALAFKVKHVSCCDYAENMVWQTEKKAKRLGLTNADFSLQDITALHFADDSFDAAVAANVLHLLPTPNEAIRELSRVVRPGGLIIIPNFVNGENGQKGRRFLHFIGSLGFRPENEWTHKQFLEFLSGSGLKLIESRMFESKQPLCVAITENIKSLL